jgi:pSer/pThr/pTyr-binding forkhead associated (FHA) protein
MNLPFGKPRSHAPEAVNAPRSAKISGRGTPSRFQLHDPNTGRSWPLYLGENKVGRGLDNDIVLNHDSISRQHAKIRVDGSSVYVDDLNSVNGTYICDERVKHGVVLPDQNIRIGLINLMIRKPGAYESGGPNWVDSWD